MTKLGRGLSSHWLVCVLSLSMAPSASAEALERLNIERLRATHERIKALANERQPVELKSGYDDVRALLHVHSSLSHDSRGTRDEIIAAAKATGVRVIMFSEHPADHYDYFTDGLQGTVDGVLLIPGAETSGFLAYPTRSLRGQKTDSPQAFADLVRRDDGLVFLSHLEEQMTWDITGLTGCEIYNTHADFKDETKFIAALHNPLTLLVLKSALEQYPQETFAAIADYPADYLKRFDELCQRARLCGVGANDAHHNQAYRLRITAEGKLQLDDALDKKLVVIDPEKMPLVKPLIADKKPGDLLFAVDIDPYERGFRHVSTHLLLKEVSRNSVWDALKQGRAYVAFDWLADPTGFVFRADRADQTWPIGSEIFLEVASPDPGAALPHDKAPAAAALRLRAAAPLPVTFKLVRDGKVILERTAAALDEPVDTPGVYRLEAWLTIAAEPRPWIISNPIYIRPTKNKN